MITTATPSLTERKQIARQAAGRTFVLHDMPSPAAWLNELAASAYAQLSSDVYGEGGAVAILEERVAKILGKPAALFFTKGVTAQQVAIRIWSQRADNRDVVVHRLSHLLLDEDDALALLNPVEVVAIDTAAPVTSSDLARLGRVPGVVACELPLRRAGFLAPAFEDLTDLALWCSRNGTAFHLDGARLWEIAAGYGRNCAELAALADSVYVSFYKGLGGISGAVLAGDETFIAEARRWRTRFGGGPYRNFPVAIAALEGLDRHLPRMAHYHRHTVVLAAALRDAGLMIEAATVVGNAFRIRFDAPAHVMEEQHLALVAETDIWWCNGFRDHDAGCTTEVMIGSGADRIDDAEIVAAFAQLAKPTHNPEDGR